MSEEVDEATGELVLAEPATRSVDLRDRSTDSWTDVLPDVVSLAKGIHSTEFVPSGLRGSVAKVTAAVLYSRELGLPPMTGLGGTHVIEGKAGISAELMRALIFQAGHELEIVESTADKCVIRGRRKGSETWQQFSWTMAEANRTQVFISKAKGWGPLSSKSQWKSWPAEMLMARATTRLARAVFPDVVHGMRSVEELQDMQQEEVADATVVQSQPVQAPVKRKRAAIPKPAAKPVPEKDEEPAEEKPADPPADKPVDEKPEPVARKRKAPPAPKTAAPVEPDPEPEQGPDDTDDSDEEVIDAEIVEDPKITKAQTQKLIIAFNSLGVRERGERLYISSVLAGRELSSANDLTLREASSLIDSIEQCGSNDELQQLVNVTADARESEG